MRIRVVDGGRVDRHRQSTLMSYIVNGTVAIDAGAIGLMTPLAEQNQVRSIFLSHSHADHTASLPLFVDNVFKPGPDCVTVYASQSTITDLQEHIFNDRIWPDVARLAETESPFVVFEEIDAGVPVKLGSLSVTPFDVDHVIPTFGFLLEDDHAAVAMVADTGPLDDLWPMLDQTPNLKAVFLEVSFPDSMQWLAKKSKHLTPSNFAAEVAKLKTEVDWYVIHIKPEHQQRIHDEIKLLRLPRCRLTDALCDYDF